MPRATTRNKPSQSQSQARSHTQARDKQGQQSQKRRGRVPDEEDEEPEDEEPEEDAEMEDGESQGEDDSVERKANNLVRLALFTEYRRTTLKRDEIAKKVLAGRATKGDFQPVLERAQHILRKTFGMELHEIMSRAERDRADAVRDGANPEDSETNVTGLKKKATAASSKQYILRSTLDKTVIEAASVCDAEIEEAERAEIDVWHPNNDERRPEGTLIAWRDVSADQLEATGVLHVILALILVNGRVLTDMQLRTYLKRLRLPTGSTIPSNTASHSFKPLTIDGYLAQLLKQSYLDKQKTSLASTQGGGGQKRSRGGAAASGGGEDGDSSFEWKWGTRAIGEIGEKGVGEFIVEFMDGIEREREGRRADEEGAGGSGKKERESVEKRKEKLVTAIGRAAGGGLVPFA